MKNEITIKIEDLKNLNKETVVALINEEKFESFLPAIYENSKGEKDVLSPLASNNNTPADILEDIAGKTEDSQINIKLAINPNTPVSVLEKLSKFDNFDVVENVILNKNVTKEIIDALIELDEDIDIKISLARYVKNEIALDKLSYIEDKEVFVELIKNKNTSEKTLIKIAKSNPELFRRCYFGDFETGEKVYNEELLNILVDSKEEYLHERIAFIEDLSDEIFEKLSKSRFSMIKKRLIWNGNCPISILKKFATVKNVNIKKEIADCERATAEILDLVVKNTSDYHSYVHYYAARNSNTSKKTLEELSRHYHYEVRENVASNPNTTKKVLDVLAKDKNIKVKVAVIVNKNTSVKALKALGKIDNDSILNAFKLREAMFTSDSERLDVLVDEDDDDIQRAVLNNQNTKASVLSKFYEKGEFLRLVAQNQNTPIEILDEILFYDIDFRWYVLKNPSVSLKSLELVLKKELSIDSSSWFCVRCSEIINNRKAA